MAAFLVIEQNDHDFINLVDLASVSRLNDHICIFRAHNFKEVLEDYLEEEFELIFLDVSTEQDLKVVDQLKRNFPSSSIILLTPIESEVIGLEAIRYGAIDYLAKSKLTSDTLNRSIRYALERNRLKNSMNAQQAQLVYSAKISSMGEMVRGVVHQINNPLAIIRASLHQMKKKKDLDAMLESIERCDQSISKISGILDGLKLFSTSDETVDLEESMAVLDTSIKATCDLCSERFSANGIKFNVPQIIPKFRIHIEQRHFMQVLLSLINNARDSVTGTEDPWVEIKIHYHKNRIDILVIDSGPGVPKSLQKKIMDPFFTTKTKKKYSGLGLSVAKGILQSYGGNLKYCTASKHTTFTFSVPHANQTQVSNKAS